MIDERAVVSAGAKIGKHTSIGAYSIIGPSVVIGDNCWIGPHVVINGTTEIGNKVKIYQFCSIGDAPQHLSYKNEPTELIIGNDNVFREYVTINRGTVIGGGRTQVGDNNYLMAYSHIAHDCQVGSHTIFANGASLAGHVVVAEHAILGGFTLVHQFCRIGAHTMTALGTIVLKDIPPYVTAAGNPAVPHGINTRGLKRRGFSDSEIAATKRAYRTIYKSGMKLEQAIDEVKKSCGEVDTVKHFIDFIKTSERGIVR